MVRLDEWGDWARKAVTGLGYNGCTIEYGLMEMGGMYNDCPACARIPNYSPSPRCSEVDRAIEGLSKKENEAIWARHVAILKNEEIKTHLGYGRRQYDRYLSKAYEQIADILEYPYTP